MKGTAYTVMVKFSDGSDMGLGMVLPEQYEFLLQNAVNDPGISHVLGQKWTDGVRDGLPELTVNPNSLDRVTLAQAQANIAAEAAAASAMTDAQKAQAAADAQAAAAAENPTGNPKEIPPVNFPHPPVL